MADVRDPVGMRDPIRILQEADVIIQGKKNLQGPSLAQFRATLGELTASLNALSLVVEVQDEQDELACQLLAIGQAFARGEGRETDDDGFLKLGDLATELADKLYAYAMEN